MPSSVLFRVAANCNGNSLKFPLCQYASFTLNQINFSYFTLRNLTNKLKCFPKIQMIDSGENLILFHEFGLFQLSVDLPKKKKNLSPHEVSCPWASV